MAGAALIGDLRFAQVPALLERADELAASSPLDLGGVQRADSAGLAFLLELTRRARARGLELVFSGAPAQVQDLARFFGLDPVLRFAAPT